MLDTVVRNAKRLHVLVVCVPFNQVIQLEHGVVLELGGIEERFCVPGRLKIGGFVVFWCVPGGDVNVRLRRVKRI